MSVRPMPICQGDWARPVSSIEMPMPKKNTAIIL
jgi:hypothetical protein